MTDGKLRMLMWCGLWWVEVMLAIARLLV